MLGYVRIYKPEMKIKEYEAYRGIYCSLCRALGKHYGVLSRLLLNYDVTFLVVVLMSLGEIRPDFKAGRCPFNPAKKCSYCQNAADQFEYAAAVTVLLFYYKVKDEIADSGFLRKCQMVLLLPYAAYLRKKARKGFGELDEIIAACMKRQSEAEKSQTDSIDAASHNSADALGKIFSYYENENSDLYRFGYLVGRWVYLIDAADDLEKDLKHKNFNVFINKFALTSAEDISDGLKLNIESTLNMCHAAVIAAYRSLDLTVLSPISENIIIESMENITANILKGKNKNERSL